jgi:hypothetical protein
MIVSLIAIASILLFAAGLVLRSEIGRTFLRYRGKRLVRCPETGAPAVVEAAALFAGLPGPFGLPRLCMTSCSLWPERADCAQPCVWQIRAAPRDTLLKTMLRRYEDDACVRCGRSLGNLPRPQDEAGVDGAVDGANVGDARCVTPELREIVTTWMPDVLTTDAAACRDCQAIERGQERSPGTVFNDSAVRSN